ncbi:cyclic nucleotide-binding domain-containing protein [Roseibium porphyridii]|uniref:Cyclic nucleotide-binding domain-containing protein n=1 Tax=Roseibium porphyridii TaxID=2866279 RepID=A0ABY8F1Y0_9HYPH|nr:cyclic nucleotide-binding domain-containing protein [Roseibium sp. KMA01]WFE89226.1 cyclic nucleotide-binding domain-containing protein [Roseibium sp. KMA01]
MAGLDVLVNVANVIYLFSYSVRDIFWLRILTLVGISLLMPYYYLQPSPLWAPIGWNTFFFCINLYWIARLLAEMRPAPFTNEEQRLFAIALQNLSERDAFKFLRMAERKTVPAGTILVMQGNSVEELSLVVEGELVVEQDGKRVDDLSEGNFVGAVALLSQKSKFSAPVTVRVSAPTTLLTWSFKELTSKFSRNSSLQIAIEASLGMEVAKWLRTTRQMLLRT